MKKLFFLACSVFVLMGCKQKPKSWQWEATYKMEGVKPIGIAKAEDGFWVSDTDHNRLVQIDEKGMVIQSIDSFERPMHIMAFENKIYVPEYGKDTITIIENNKRSILEVTDSLDAPAGIAVFENEKAIANFYNHRFLYAEDGVNFKSFGKEGKAEGDFYYPTDIQITKDKIWVADAYNNRVQAFDKQGNFVKAIGADQNMNAATGLYVSEDEVFVTDFENDRVLIFDMEGNLKQELSENIEKPTDMMIEDNKLYIINYGSGTLNLYNWKEVEAANEDEHSD